MAIDEDRIDEAVLAPLYPTLCQDGRAWKNGSIGKPWTVSDRRR